MEYSEPHAIYRQRNVHPVVLMPDFYEVYDFTLEQKFSAWGVGRYNEVREGIYTAPQFQPNRCVHMGIDIGAPETTSVFSPLDGEVAYRKIHTRQGDYGGCIVIRYEFYRRPLYALFGHLSHCSVYTLKEGQKVLAGEPIGLIGNQEENGNWPPHLHFQLSFKDPLCADMPGAVSPEQRSNYCKVFPDPRIILGPLY